MGRPAPVHAMANAAHALADAADAMADVADALADAAHSKADTAHALADAADAMTDAADALADAAHALADEADALAHALADPLAGDGYRTLSAASLILGDAGRAPSAVGRRSAGLNRRHLAAASHRRLLHSSSGQPDS